MAGEPIWLASPTLGLLGAVEGLIPATESGRADGLKGILFSLRFCPSSFSGFPRATAPLFRRHGFQATFAADSAAFGSHFPHDFLDDTELDPCTLWHAPSVAQSDRGAVSR